MFWVEKTERRPGPDIRIECPACLAHDALAATHDEKRSSYYLGVIRLLVSRRTLVVCSLCRAQLTAQVVAADLADKDPGELASLIAFRASFLQKALALLALVVVLFPWVDLVVAVMAAVANRKIPGWTRRLSYVCAAIAGLITIAASILVAVEGSK